MGPKGIYITPWLQFRLLLYTYRLHVICSVPLCFPALRIGHEFTLQGYQAIVPTSASLAQHRTQQHAHQHAVQATQQRAAQQRGSSTQKQMRPTKAVRKAAAGQYEADVASSLSQVE